jgi:hypothetical protein
MAPGCTVLRVAHGAATDPRHGQRWTERSRRTSCARHRWHDGAGRWPAALGSAAVLDKETRPRWWRLGAKVRRGGGGDTRLGGPDDGEVDAVVALGSPSSAMPQLGTHNEEAVRVTVRR